MISPYLADFRYCPRCGSPRFIDNNTLSRRCEECGLAYYINPKAAVVAVITNSRGDILVCRRAKEPARGTLDLPGGFCDPEESAEEAVAREVMEETSLTVTSCRYLFSLPNVYTYTGMAIPTMDLFFECEVASLSSLSAHDDASEVRFIPRDEIVPADFGLTSIRRGITRLLAHKE
ncbi:MAG: NUDIX domain-containing protein [Coprobacter sp.]|nr:NUDIX domain-containing protein [Coprobacter sp.]